jgi:hypothetical protein
MLTRLLLLRVRLLLSVWRVSQLLFAFWKILSPGFNTIYTYFKIIFFIFAVFKRIVLFGLIQFYFSLLLALMFWNIPVQKYFIHLLVFPSMSFSFMEFLIIWVFLIFCFYYEVFTLKTVFVFNYLINAFTVFGFLSFFLSCKFVGFVVVVTEI